MQDMDGADFPGEQGDVKLVPMLELQFDSDNGQLPSAPDQARYGIVVRDLDDSSTRQVAYVPLQLVSDPASRENMAFHAKMLYLPTANWSSPHQVRLVWLVQALVDSGCNRNGSCNSYNDVQVIHTYPDDFRLTGFSITENHGRPLGRRL